MSDRFVRWSGPAAMLGGVLWIVGTVVHASKPVGCVGDGCAVRPMRESGTVEGILTLVSLLLVVAAAVGLVVLVRRAGRFGRTGRAGTLVGAVGVSLLVAAGLVQAIFFGGDFPLMPFFVVPGLLAVVVGFLLLGVAVLRAQVLPRWAAGTLVVGVLAMLGFNEQTTAAWLGVPFGIGWIAVGYALLGAVRPRSVRPAPGEVDVPAAG